MKKECTFLKNAKFAISVQAKFTAKLAKTETNISLCAILAIEKIIIIDSITQSTPDTIVRFYFGSINSEMLLTQKYSELRLEPKVN